MKNNLLKLQVLVALGVFLSTWKAFPEHSLRFPRKFEANTVLSSFIEASNYPNYDLASFFSFFIRPFAVFLFIFSSTLSLELSCVAFSYLFVNFAFLQTLQQSESIYCLLLFCLQGAIFFIGADGPLSWGLSTLLFIESSVLMSSFVQPVILIFMPLILFMTKVYGTGSKLTRRLSSRYATISCILYAVLPKSKSFNLPSILLDIALPYPTQVDDVSKLPLFILSSIIITKGAQKLSQNNAAKWYNPCFLVLCLGSISSLQQLANHEPDFHLHKAFTLESDVKSWRRVAKYHFLAEEEYRRQEIVSFRKQAAFSESYLQDAFSSIKNEYHATNWALFAISESKSKSFWADKLLPEHYDRVRSFFTSKKEISSLLKLLEKKEMYNKALAVLQEAELESKMAWDKVKFHLKLRQPMDAMKTLMSLVTKDPANLRARAYTAAILFKIGNSENTINSSIEHLTSLIESDDFSLAHHFLAKVFLSHATEDFQKAKIHLEKSIDFRPNNRRVQYDLARTYLALGELENLEKLLPKLYEITELEGIGIIEDDDMAELSERFDWGRLWLLIASTESKLRNWKATNDAYRHASFRLEGSQAIWSQLGQCLNMIDALELAEAQDCVEKMIAEVPANFEEKLLELKDLVLRMQKVALSKKLIKPKIENAFARDAPEPREPAENVNTNSNSEREDSEQEKAEMKARMRALFERTQKQQKTSSLMDELTDLKSTLHGEVKSMAETEVLAYQNAAISKLNKIKELIKNNVENN